MEQGAHAVEKQEAVNAGTTEPICADNANAEAGTDDKMGRGDENGSFIFDIFAGHRSPRDILKNDTDGAGRPPCPPKTTTNAVDGSGTKRKRGSSTVNLTADDTPEKDTSLLVDIALEMQIQRQQQLALLAAAHRNRKDSLRLSASRIAALTGFNPYADLPNLIMDLIYQGYAGQILLSQDASLLGMELVSRDTAVEELLAKAATSATEVAKTAKDKAEAKEIQTAVKQITKIQRGEAKPPSTVASATKMKTGTLAKIKEVQKKLPKTSKAKLSSGEVKMLNESIRSVVDTNFGTHHENEALDLYEKRYGCEVRERNEGIYCWDFIRGEEGSDEDKLQPVSINEPTAIPLGLAKKLYDNADEDSADNDGNDKLLKPPVCVDLTDDADNDSEKTEPMKKSGDTDDSEPSARKKQKSRPFFSILGSFDGIRDELFYVPPAASSGDTSSDCQDSDQESWALRPIVVECKHRMRKLYNPPPLYDQIQSTVYCLMHGTDEADLVQVLRSEKKKKAAKAKKREEKEKDNEEAKTHPKITDFGYVAESKTVGDNNGDDSAKGESKLVEKENGTENDAEAGCYCNGDSKDDTKHSQDAATQERDEKEGKSNTKNTELNILVTRIKLDDPTTQHRSNFQYVILPRLRSIVDAIYNIRSDDDKRYRFLVNASSSDVDDAARKTVMETLFMECPWLRHCDISRSWRA